MAKFIRRVLLFIIVAAGIITFFQWKHYQKKLECRTNALVYFKEKDYEKAITYLEEGLKGGSVFGKEIDKDMSCYLAESYYQLGENEKAVKLYDELLEKNPKEKMYYLLKGDANISLGDTDQAVKVYNKGWKETSDSFFIEKICEAFLSSKDYENALKYAKVGEEASEKDAAKFMFEQIVIYEKWTDYESAYQKAKEYMKKYPKDEKGQKELKFLTTRIQ